MFNKQLKLNRRTVWLLVAAIIFGFIAGIGGQFFASNFIFNYLTDSQQLAELNDNFYELLTKYNFLTAEDRKGPLEIVIRRSEAKSGLATVTRVEAGNFLENLQRGTVTFYKQKPAVGDDLLFSAYQQREALGRGFILTNDGWLVTTREVLIDLKGDYIVLTNKREVYPLTKIVTDSLTEVVFVKIEANNLSVLSLADKGRVELGQAIISLDQDGGIKAGQIENNYYRQITTNRDLIISSDVLDDYYLSSDLFKKVSSGETVIDSAGRVVGLIVGRGEQKMILPLINFSGEITEVLRAEKITRSQFGINYLDLRQVIINPAVNSSYQGLRRGALIYTSSYFGLPGVKPGSPAERAGLKAGQVILKVEGEEINNRVSLNQLIQEYNPGDEIELTVWEEGEEKKIRLILE